MNDKRQAASTQAVIDTDLKDLQLVRKGKVRDVYDMGDSLLMIATDRISAFDVVMPNPIPGKGKVLNLISLFWFDIMKSVTDNHIISSKVEDFPASCQPYADMLKDRSVLVKKAEPLPVECIVRGYVSGSGWMSYKESQHICGINLPAGLVESDRLPEPIFTPSTKAEQGEHDINIDFEEAKSLVGKETAEKIRDLSLMIYQKGSSLAAERGIIIADTKFEFGICDGNIILIDEVLTPDSSRFWPKDSYKPGGAQKSFDKQYLRDYLLSLNWNKKAPGPQLPDDIIVNTKKKYLEALTLLTSKEYEI